MVILQLSLLLLHSVIEDIDEEEITHIILN